MSPDSPTHRIPSTRGRRRLHRLWVVGAALLAVGVALPLFIGSPGTSLLEIDSPRLGEVVGAEGLEVLVRFPALERVAPETLRVLLNGADVTENFTTGENGAYGRLFALLDGENVLRVEVFATFWWPSGLFLEHDRETWVVHRRPLDVNRG